MTGHASVTDGVIKIQIDVGAMIETFRFTVPREQVGRAKLGSNIPNESEIDTRLLGSSGSGCKAGSWHQTILPQRPDQQTKSGPYLLLHKGPVLKQT